MRNRGGVTLLEVMVVVAIIGVIASMSVSTFADLGRRSARRNVTNELMAMLQLARNRSLQNGSDVYVLIYPQLRKSDGSLTAGSGGVFVYEDMDGDFLQGTGACDGSVECSWSGFSPPGDVQTITTDPAIRDRVLKSMYLSDFPFSAGLERSYVRFGKTADETWTPPFLAIAAAADANGCSFCEDGKGAILFSDGQAVFLDKDGRSVAQAVGGIALQSTFDERSQSLIGLVRSTALISLVRTP